MSPIKPLVVIGAGPAGIMAAITAARSGLMVLILEKKNEIGGKIPIAGDGKGNLTNIDLALSHYHSRYPDFVLPAITGFDFLKTREFFEKLGLKFFIDCGGRVFPYSREATIIQRLLMDELQRLDVEIVTGADIRGIGKIGSYFEIIMNHSPSFYTYKIILATGGLAAPQMGSTVDGYIWAEGLGHQIETQFPALIQLTINHPSSKFLGKLRLDEVIVTLLVENQKKASKEGSILFIPGGVSGTAIFSISRVASKALIEGKRVEIQINLAPDLTEKELGMFFIEKKKSHPQLRLINLLNGILPERICQILLGELNIKLDLIMGNISENKIKMLIHRILNFSLTVVGTQSWKYAQVTCGGISVKNINSKTMESKIVPNLYFAGEILDVDGDCGGYNLQWAWSSGYLAGKSAASYRERKNSKQFLDPFDANLNL